MKKFKFFLLELRAPFMTATVVPVFLGTAIAWAKYRLFDLPLFFVTLFGALLLHAGTNVLNDYFDHLSGTDWDNKSFVFPFTGGSRLIQAGILTPKEVLIEGIILFALAVVIGAVLVYLKGPVILILGLIGLFSGIFYTAPPLFLAGRGLGEFLVGLNFGVLMTIGAYFVQTSRFDLEPLVASIPVAFLITGVLYINQFPDAEADARAGKKHLVVRLGKEKAVKVFALILILSYVTIAAGAFFGALTPLTLVALLTVPTAIKIIQIAKKNYSDSKALAPANATTIKLHMLVGFILTVAYIVDGIL